MAQPYIGEIRMFAGNFAPAGWAFCGGQLMAIVENDALFQLIGTTYGGDGQSTFALPNLQSRIPLHMGTGPDGNSYPLAQMAGVETVTLTTQQIPLHTHALLATGSTATSREAVPNHAPAIASGDIYSATLDPVPLSASTIAPTGGSQPHENCQPFVCINYIISLFGIVPTPT